MEILNENSTFSEWGERWKKRVLIDATYTYTHDINSQLNHMGLSHKRKKTQCVSPHIFA